MVSLAEAMKEPTVSVVSDLEVQSDTLLVAFGGGFGAYFMPRFEFSRMASDLPVKKLFIREHEPTWYQGGIPGLGLGSTRRPARSANSSSGTGSTAR